MSTNGEVFRFMAFAWDIEKAKKIVSRRVPLHQLDVDDVFNAFLSGHEKRDDNKLYLSLIGIDTDHALSDLVDLKV